MKPCVLQIITFVVVERGVGHKGQQIRNMMQKLEPLWLAKRHTLGGNNVQQKSSL